MRILGIPEAAFYAPALAVFFQQDSRAFVAEAGRQAPRFFHVLGLNANNSSHEMALGGHRGAAKNACSSALANPVDRRLGFAIRSCDFDIPSETNEIIEFQLFGQHPVELVIAKSPVGHNQDFDLSRQGFGKPNQHLTQKMRGSLSVTAAAPKNENNHPPTIAPTIPSTMSRMIPRPGG